MIRSGVRGRLMGGLALAAALLVVGGGCSNAKPTGTVSGQVVYKNGPITDGEVHFLSKSGAGARASIDGGGNYTVADPLPTDTYKVYVAPHPPGQSGPPGTVKVKRNSSLIPKKYREPATSGLSYTVTEGKNDYKIELKD